MLGSGLMVIKKLTDGIYTHIAHLAADGQAAPMLLFFFANQPIAWRPCFARCHMARKQRAAAGRMPRPIRNFFSNQTRRGIQKKHAAPIRLAAPKTVQKSSGHPKKQRAGKVGANKRSCARNRNKSRGQRRRAAKRRCR